jgi:hypothetical protein
MRKEPRSSGRTAQLKDASRTRLTRMELYHALQVGLAAAVGRTARAEARLPPVVGMALASFR